MGMASPNSSAMLSVLRRKSAAERLGRSPGFGGAERALLLLHLPWPTAKWSFEASVLHHSGGTAPDSHRTSYTPSGTQTRVALYHDFVRQIKRVVLTD
jgi:hypothetical protein